LQAAREGVKRRVVVGVCVLGALLAAASTASAAQPPRPSCNGIFSSSAAGDPGHVAEAAHFVKELSEAFGVPPGLFTSAGAHAHGATLADCGGWEVVEPGLDGWGRGRT
jgi:hypothetical protein